MKRKQKIRYIILGTLLLLIWTTQLIPAMGEGYARSVYPVISFCLSSFSRLFPFAIGDLFIFLSITGVILYPIYGRIKNIPGKRFYYVTANIFCGYMYGSISHGG